MWCKFFVAKAEWFNFKARRLIPLFDRIVLRRMEVPTTTASGLALPKEMQDTADLGEVLAVGPGRLDDSGKHIPPVVKVGDTVVLGDRYVHTCYSGRLFA